MGEKREFLVNKQQLAAVLATCEWGAVVWHLLQRRLVWGRAAGTPRRCPCEGSECRSHVPGEGSLQLWNLQHLCAAGGLASTVLLLSDLSMPIFLSRDTDSKGVGTYYISHLLMHATYTNIFKCLSWWMNNFHYLALVLVDPVFLNYFRGLLYVLQQNPLE